MDSNGRCLLAEVVEDRDPKSRRPFKWKCTSECKLPTLHERRCIYTVKGLFHQHVHKLREKLNGIDNGCAEHGHYTIPLNTPNEHCGLLYRNLSGHPLPCSVASTGCDSSPRILRAVATLLVTTGL